jgi:hypothetical protein
MRPGAFSSSGGRRGNVLAASTLMTFPAPGDDSDIGIAATAPFHIGASAGDKCYLSQIVFLSSSFACCRGWINASYNPAHEAGATLPPALSSFPLIPYTVIKFQDS